MAADVQSERKSYHKNALFETLFTNTNKKSAKEIN